MHSASLSRNSFWLLLARFSVQGLAVIFVAFTARQLGASIFGQFSVIASIVLIGNTLTTFGTDTLIIRETAKQGHVTDLVFRALGLQLSLSILWCLLTFFLIRDLPLLLYTLGLVPLAFFSVASAVLRAFQRMDLFWLLNVGNGLIQVAAGVLATDLWSLCIYLLVGQVLVALLAVWMCRGFLPSLTFSPFLDMGGLWKLTWPFAALSTLTMLSQRLGILFVSAMVGDVGTGLYSASARLVDGMKFGHYAVLGALLPMLARGNPGARNEFRVGFLAMTMFSTLMASVVLLLSKPITLIFYGSEYEDAAALLQIACWSIIPYTISAFISVDMVSRGMEADLLIRSAIAIAAFTILFLLLISWYDLTGAAYAALLGETVQAVIFVQAWSVLKTSRA